MRTGGCTVQQALTPEASAILKQAVSLARHRGHAQVTPLHVATTMLSSPSGLLRSACLHSHSHPLRCKALDLCFNVALNRLPSSSSQILVGTHRAHHHHQHPSLSNALVAAFKRAQAHQRRGSAADTQQQPMLAVKIDLEQLIISILDDPSVSRVMREAGFSSTQVKTNVEKAISLEMTTPPNPNPNHNPNKPVQGGSLRSEDVMTVVESLMGRKRSSVIVRECLAACEGVVRGLMDGVKKGEVPEDLKSLQFITLPLFSFEKMSGEEVREKVGELRCLVRSCSVGRRVVLYLGDLKWAVEYWASCGERRGSFHCAIESVMKEIGEMVYGGGESFWLMAIATCQTYMRCRVGNPSLETLWGLQPLTVPAVSLDLSLKYDSSLHSQLRSKRGDQDGPCWSFLEGRMGNELTRSSDVSLTFETEARGLTHIASSTHGLITSALPPWLQQHKEDSRRATINDLVSFQFKDQSKQWNSMLNTGRKHQQYPLEKTLDFSSVSPSSSSLSSSHETHQPSPHNYPNSTSSTGTIEVEYLPKFKELNAENLKTMCNSLEKVSWQKEIIPEIASTILQCRSGMMIREERLRSACRIKEETWLFFLGTDTKGKEKIARELATLVFGSHTNFTSIGLSNFSSNDRRRKRSRLEEASHSYLERLAEAIRDNPHRIIMLEDVEQVDYYSQMGIKTAIDSGRVRSSTGEDVAVSDAIMILSCESFDLRSRACSPSIKQKLESDEGKEEKCVMTSSVGLDLNLCADGEEVEDWSFDDVRLLEAVDRTFVFKSPDDL